MNSPCLSSLPPLQIDTLPAPSSLSFSAFLSSGRWPPDLGYCPKNDNRACGNGRIVCRNRRAGDNGSTVRRVASPDKLEIPTVNRASPNGRRTGDGTVNGRVSRTVNGQESRMIPIKEALRKNSIVNVRDGAPRPAISSTVNGALNKYSKDASSSSTTNDGTALVPRNGSAAANQITGPRVDAISRLEHSKLLQTPLEVLGWDENVTVLPSDESFSWSKESYNNLQRTFDVWTFVLALRGRVYLDGAKWTFVGGFSEEKQKARRRKTASWVRESILQLGPTFIKVGQLSSTRSDLFPAEFVEELSKLQDRVPAFTSEKAMALIQKELGQPVDVLFKVFEQQPIAAASLGQVHRAVLPSGEKVVVKIQRPALKELFDIDLGNLKRIAEYFQNSETLGGPTRDWLGIYEECATILYQEIDYINEGRNADRLRRDFRNVRWVRIPQIFWDYTTCKILTLEYVPGIKINDVALLDAGGFDRSKIASRAVEAYLIQILKTGFFHADPHPGNLALDVDGSLIYYDFGMMGEIKAFTREKLLEMFYAVYDKDAKKVIQALIDLGALTQTGDMMSVRRSIQFFLNNLMSQRPDEASTISAIGEDLFAIALDQPFRFPATFTFVLRAFSTLEGIGYILDPDFSFAKVAAPYAQELLDVKNAQRNGNYLFQELQRQANEARDAAVTMPTRIQRIYEILQQLEQGDLKLRVRVLEAERAARRASVLQMATIYTVAAGTLLNVGISLNGQGLSTLATATFFGSGAFVLLLVRAMRRVQRLDKFEKMI